MSLWNDIKGWFDKEEPQQKPEQPAGEAAQVVEEQSVEELLRQMCAEAGVHSSILRKTNAIALFCEWYDGDGSRKCIADCFEKFKSQHPLIQKKLGNTLLK